jgi:hypothetical protein
MEMRAGDKYICYQLSKQSIRIIPIPWPRPHNEAHRASQGKMKKIVSNKLMIVKKHTGRKKGKKKGEQERPHLMNE